MKKKILLLAICFLILSTNAFAELTQSDLENIDKLIQASETRIKEYVDLKINASEAKLSGQIKALDERLSGQIKALDERLSGQIKALDERLSGQINALDGQMTQIYGFVIALVALIAVAVGLPQILVARQGKEMRTQDQRIEALQQEIEKLKQERIDRP
jgi:peptidoglycan hydrolase CwlO-like protein